MPIMASKLSCIRTSAFDKKAQSDKPLTAEELDIIRRLQENENPDANYDPYEPTIEWFTGKGKEEIMPLSAAPEPKRRWVPSKWEKQKVTNLLSSCLSFEPPTAGDEDRESNSTRPYCTKQTQDHVRTTPVLRNLE